MGPCYNNFVYYDETITYKSLIEKILFWNKKDWYTSSNFFEIYHDFILKIFHF